MKICDGEIYYVWSIISDESMELSLVLLQQ